jgi:DNA-binding transcriptional ArsR family regulator
MLNYQQPLDLVFQALADPTRRVMVERLSRGPASVSELARPHRISLPAVMQHLQVLETSGLVRSEKVGRVRTCRIGARRLEEVAAWIERYHQLWDARFGELDQVIEELKRQEKSDGRNNPR